MRCSWLFGLVIVLAWRQQARAGTDVRLDQAGYLPEGKKIATVSSDKASTFEIVDAKTRAIVFKGTLSAPVTDVDSGDTVRLADFTALHEQGSFYLKASDAAKSWTFSIRPNVFRPVYFLAMRSYYGQRCGTPVDLAPDFPQRKHAACHLEGAYDPSTGKQGLHASAKGWHDAGDYGRYVVNGGISTGTLLWTWELFHQNIEKVSLHIPESGGRVPDILSEIRWNLDWMMSLQDSDGGVFHKQTSSHFAPFLMPEKDKLTSLVIGTGSAPFKGSCATGDLAAVAAIAARAFRPYDAAYADQALRSAQSAWAWIEKNPNVTFKNPAGISTGEYGDSNCDDEHLWAAAELARTTGEERYRSYFLTHYGEFLDGVRADAPPSWNHVADLALWTYVLGGATDAAATEIRTRSLAAADEIASRTSQHPYGTALQTADYIWGSNGVAMNYAMQLLIANRFQASPAFVAAALDNLHYVLGRNAFSLSWVTQVGDHSFQHPHHRPSDADGVDAPWPGLMSGGPNPGRQDSIMKRVVPADVKPARAYVDETGAYACNEVAINWNAPLVFVLAAVTQ